MVNDEIFQIGFNRCGITSIHSFFQENGISSIHYDRGKLAKTLFDNLAQGKHILRGYEKYDAFTDMEWLTHDKYREGYKLYLPIMAQVPEAKFILNVWHPDKWIMSRLVLSGKQRPSKLSDKVVYGGKIILLGNFYEMHKAFHGLVQCR